MPTEHATLAPSASKRWMACGPSARLEARMPQKDTAYTREGTIAHAMAESLLRFAISENWEKWNDMTDVLRAAWKTAQDLGADEMPEHVRPFLELADKAIAEGLDPWEMMETVSEHYCSHIWEDYMDAKYRDPDAVLLVEQRLKLDEFIPEGFGSSDAIIIYGSTLTVYDLKYGKGVKVSAVDNSQMRCYALGALCGPGELYSIKEVAMVIIQPRLQWWSTDTISAAMLLDWGHSKLKPAAVRAFAGNGDFVPGDHCRFCSIAPRCKAFLANVTKSTREFSTDIMSAAELATVLKSLPAIKAWATNVEAYALQLVQDGGIVPGFKVVEGRSLRQIGDQKAAIATLEKAGFDESSYMKPRELKTIGDLEKLLKKKGFQELLGQYVIKPAGKPTLVEDSDPRPSITSAKDDFKDLI